MTVQHPTMTRLVLHAVTISSRRSKVIRHVTFYISHYQKALRFADIIEVLSDQVCTNVTKEWLV